MKPSVAAETLLAMEKEGKRGILSDKAKVVLLRGIGWASPTRKYCSMSELAKYDSAEGPAVMIVPSSSLHFIELEFLESL
jgi:diphthamide biosynthesis methyltransferase